MIFPGNLFLVQVIVVAAVICPHYIAFYYSRSLTASMSCFEKLTEMCEPSRLFERLDVSRNAYWCEEESGTLASVRRDEMQEEQKACFHLHPFKTNSEITSEQICWCGCDGLAPELKAVKTTFKHRPVMTDDMTSSLSNRCHRIRIQNASDISSNTILKAVIVKIGGSVNMPTAFCHLSTSLRCLMHSYKALRINADITFNRLACDKKKKKAFRQFHLCQSVLHHNQTARSKRILRPLPHREEQKARLPGGCRMSAPDTAEPQAGSVPRTHSCW